jgi:hypothetical protein
MKKKIGLYSDKIRSKTYTVAKAISMQEDYENYLITPEKENAVDDQHLLYLGKINKIKNIKVASNSKTIKIDHLYIELSTSDLSSNIIDFLRSADHLNVLYYRKKQVYIKNLFTDIKQLIKNYKILFRTESIGYIDGLYNFDLFSFFSRKYIIGFDVHSKFLENKKLKNLMFAFEWMPQLSRKFKINYMGNINPQNRAQILKKIKFFLDESNIEFKVLWIDYGNRISETRGVLPEKYIEYLSESDFTLCPPGYERVTHRVIEALVRGSIPIINEDELYLYDMNLQNEVNCIAVKESNWIAAIQKILKLKDNQLIQMRYNILAMKEKYLLPEVAAKRLRQKMGLE